MFVGTDGVEVQPAGFGRAAEDSSVAPAGLARLEPSSAPVQVRDVESNLRSEFWCWSRSCAISSGCCLISPLPSVT